LIKLERRILAIPLAFSLILPVASFVYLFITRQVPVEQRLFYSHIWDIVEFFLNPVLLFVVSYYVTKRMELRYGYSVTISLLLGSLAAPTGVSVFLGLWTLIADPVFPHSAQSNIAYSVSSLLGGISKGLQTFFVSFTAMTIASISE